MRMAFVAGIAGLLAAQAASAQIRITEWMYSGGNGEYIELTNMGDAPVDFTNWSYDDDSVLPGSFSLSGFGLVAPGESVVLTENTEATFRAAWGLSAAVKILGGYTNNLGRNDQINIFDNTTALVDRLSFGDEAFVGSIRTQNRSGGPQNVGVLGTNNVFGWSFVNAGGDPFSVGFSSSTAGDIGNPGRFIPAPGAAALLAIGGLTIARRRR